MATKYSKASAAKVKKAMEEMKAGTLRSGRTCFVLPVTASVHRARKLIQLVALRTTE